MKDSENPALVRLLFRQAPVAASAGPTIAFLLLFSAGGWFADWLIVGWFAAVLTVALARYVLVLRFKRQRALDTSLHYWSRLYVLTSLASGVLWGLASTALLLSGNPELRFLAAFVIGGMLAGAISTNVSYRPAFFGFALPVLLPLPLVFWVEPLGRPWVLGLLVLVFLALISRSATRLHSLLHRSIGLGQVNAKLLNKMNVTHARLLESEQRFRTLAETTSTAIFTYGKRVEYVNPAGEALCGYSNEELLAHPLWAIVHPDDRQMVRKRSYRRLLGKKSASHTEFRILTKNGETRWVDFHAGLVSIDDRQVAMGSAFDITRRKVAEEGLFLEKELAQITLGAIADAVVTTNPQGSILTMNRAADLLCAKEGVPSRKLAFRSVFELLKLDGSPCDDPVAASLRTLTEYRPSEPLMLARGADIRMVEIAASPILSPQGVALGCVVVMHDVTALHEMGREMSYHASHDTLTGLVNRREFLLRLGRLVEGAKAEDVSHAMCYLDLDQFKVVNDTCGHMAGDELLRQVTALLKQPVREGDTLGRLGGDEFGLQLAYCPLVKAAELAEEMRLLLNDYRFVWEGRQFEIGASIGVVAINAATESVNDLLRAADAACYIAKDEGRNRVHVHRLEDVLANDEHQRKSWVERVQRGMQEDHFTLFGQKIQPYASKHERTHLEVLLRLQDVGRELIPPGAFLPAAQRNKLMPELDRWVIRNALDRLAPLLRSGNVECSLNLAGQSIGDDALPLLILDEISRHGIAPEAVCIEISEASVLADMNKAVEFFRRLKAAGCRVALDHFGTGFTSFNYLKQLPVDYLKIDPALVRALDQASADGAIVQAIVSIANSMQKKTIAAGVEQAGIYQKLASYGVDYAQGFFIEHPQPIARWLH